MKRQWYDVVNDMVGLDDAVKCESANCVVERVATRTAARRSLLIVDFIFTLFALLNDLFGGF